MSRNDDKDTMREQYDFRPARRGVHHERHREGTNVRLLSPELTVEFRDDEAVNNALREYLRLKRESA